MSRAGKRIEMLGRLRNTLTAHSANVVYSLFIRPVIKYCDSAWVCCGKEHTQQLERLQKRAARILTKCNRSDIALSNLK